jgi:hypothetical protein
MDNRHALIVDCKVTQATGTGERDAAKAMAADRPGAHQKTIGADKNYDCDDPGNPIISRSDSNYDRPGQLSAFLRDLSICIDGADQLRSVVT